MNIDVAILTETWLTEQTVENIHLLNYNIASTHSRQKCRHGGIAVVIKNGTMYKELAWLDEHVEEMNFEVTGIEIVNMNTLIIGIYKSQKANIDIFFEKMTTILNVLNKKYSKKTIIIGGDFNIDLFKNTLPRNTLLNIMSSGGLSPCFHEASRQSACLDNIFTDGTSFSTNTIEVHLADHRAQLLTIPVQVVPIIQTEIKKSRIINEKTLEVLTRNLENQNWVEVLNIDEPEKSFSSFLKVINERYLEACPETKIKMRNKHKVNWYTKKLKNMRKMLDTLATIVKTQRRPEMEKYYKLLRKEYRREIVETRRNANIKHLQKATNKQKAIFELIHNEKKTSKRINTTTTLTADEINDYLVNIGNNIVSKISGTKKPVKDFLNKQKTIGNSFFLFDATEDEILNIGKMIKAKNTKDIYEHNTIVIKKILPTIVSPLTQLINKCFNSGKFPECLKVAKVTPIPKKLDGNKAENYRPISILPAVSKILEMLLKNRIVAYFEKEKLFSGNQHGYRTGKSTITAMVDMVTHILESYDKNEEVQVVCCDLSKAFDCVDHEILLQKLEYYGIRGIPHQLLTSYLTNRTQILQFKDQSSKERAVTCGVPQGSVLGPVLFLIYMNDLVSNIRCDAVCMFADDTTFINKGEKNNETTKKAQMSLADASDWFSTNKLLLNPDKSQKLTFTLKTSKEHQTIKFLGVTFQSNLKWDIHVEILTRKLSSSVFLVRRMMDLGNEETALTAYYSSFHSRMAYGILVWGGCSRIQEVLKLQKKCIRIICKCNRRQSCRDLFRKLGILTVCSLYILTCLLYVFDNRSKYLKNNHYHDYITRKREELMVIKHRVGASQHGTNHECVKLFNKLPPEVKTCESRSLFRRKVVDILLKNTIYELKEFYQ